MSLKISAMNAAATVTGKELVPLVQSGDNVQVPLGQLFSNLGYNNLLTYIPAAEHAAIFLGTSTYDCLSALNTAIASVGVNALTSSTLGGPRIYAPPGRYEFSASIELKRTVILEGDAVGQAGGFSTIFSFPINTTGIIVQRFDTTGSTTQSPTTQGGDASIVRNLYLIGTKTASTSGHGIWLRARAEVDNVRISGFAENGINIVATSGGAANVQGNANNFHLHNCRITGNGLHGLFVDGADTNAGVIDHIDCSQNDSWGIYDSSFLGNNYLGCHTNGNGLRTQVSDGANRYYTINAALAGTTVPGTDATVWVLVSAGGVTASFPLWVNGTTYLEGGSYKTDGVGAKNLFLNPYMESGQPPALMSGPTIVIGNNITYQTASTHFSISAVNSTGFGTLRPFSVESRTNNTGSVVMTPALNRAADEAFTVNGIVGDNASGMSLATWDNVNFHYVVRHARSGTQTPVRYTSDLSTSAGGRSSAIPAGNIILAQGIWLGSTLSLSRFMDNGTAAPSSGDQATGEIRFRSNATVGGHVGWYCVAGGSPGTFAPFGALQSMSADKGNAAATLTVGSSDTTNRWNTAITADRAVTLSTTNAYSGAKFRIVRTAAATGAFNVNVGTGPLKALAVGTWCDVEYDGSAWILTAYGAL